MSTVNSLMTDLANAIREKSGASGKLSIVAMTEAVNGITLNTGGDIDFTGVNVTANDLLSGVVAVNASGVKVTGNIETVTLSQNGNTVSIGKGYTEGGSITVANTPEVIPSASVDVNGNIITISAGLIEEQTIEIPEAEITRTENSVTVGIGYIGSEQVFEYPAVAESSIEYGFIDNNKYFQAYDLTVFPPVTIGEARSEVLRTLKFTRSGTLPDVSGGEVTIQGYADAETWFFDESELLTESVSVDVSFTGFNPSTCYIEYYNTNAEEWQEFPLDGKVTTTVPVKWDEWMPNGRTSPEIIKLRGDIGNDISHSCKLVISKPTVEYKKNDGDLWKQYTCDFVYQIVGDLRTLCGNAKQIQPYMFNGLFADTHIKRVLSRAMTDEELNADSDWFATYDLASLQYSDLATECYAYMFANAKHITGLFGALPAVALADRCYYHMFENSGITSMELYAQSFGEQSCAYMFANSDISTIKVHFTDWATASCTENWVKGVGNKGTFYKPAALPEIFDDSHIPVDWTVINYEDITETETA